jgi:DNA gyrase subunit A
VIESISIETEIQQSYLSYSLSVIIGRAIPDVRDGLKPVHRRILFAMHELGNTASQPHKKSARIVGDVLGKYHPHGDSAVYDALVRMAQTFSMRDVLVDGQGNFGSIDGDSAAASRYTEVRMTRLANEFLSDIEKQTVDYRPNYDNSLQEPVVLPTKVPNLLLNGSSGIAVGMATNIPPHNLGELCDGLLLVLDNPDCTIHDLMNYIKGPDFPTGASIYVGRGLEEAYSTGRGSIRIRGVVEVEERKKGLQAIVIKEIPYALNKSSLVEKIAYLINERKIEGVSDLRDESDRKGIRVVLDLKKGSIPDIVINALYKFTPLETSFGVNMLAVVDNRPKTLNIKQILVYFLEHRRQVIVRRSRYDLEKSEKRAHIVEGLRKALDHIDAIIALIRASATPAEAKDNLIAQFGFSAEQSQAILDMRLQRLTNLERDKLLEEYTELLKTIEFLRSVIEREEVLKSVIREELENLRQTYATPRRTVIMDEPLSDIAIEDLIPDDEVVITLSRRGYIKRTSLDNYQQQRRGGKGIAGVHTADDDYVHQFCTTSNHQFLLTFTNKGKMHLLKVHQVPEGGRTAKGMHIANLLPLDKDEYIAAALAIREFSQTRFLLFVTRNGMVKRSAIEQYQHCRRNGLIAVGLRPDDELIMVCEIPDDAEAIMVTQRGYSIRFKCSDVRAMGRGAAGVRGVNLAHGDKVMGAVVVGDTERTELLTISANGYGKRTQINEYRLQSRGGKGVIDMRVTPKTGNVVGAAMVNDKDEVILLTSGNKVIRTNVSGVRVVGRATQGVILVSMDDNVYVAGFDIVRETPIDL